MALTFQQKSAIRRHLDYPVVGLIQQSAAGGSVASAFSGYRFFQTYGRLEWKMNNLNPDEEARLVGKAYGAVAFIGLQPTAGDQVSITFSGGNLTSPQTITATMPSYSVGTDGLTVFGAALVSAALQNSALRDADIIGITPYGTGPFNQNQIPLAEVAFISPVTFSLTNPTGTGVVVPQITASGSLLTPTATVDGTNTVYGYIPILDALETAYADASPNLDTIAAGPWKARDNEIGQRLSLYRNWQIRLSRFLEIPLYIGPGTSNQRLDYATTMRYY